MSAKRKKLFFQTVWMAVGILMFIALMMPLYWMLCSSFMSTTEIFDRPPHLIPPHPTLKAYKDILNMPTVDVMHAFKNSFIIAFGCMIISVTLSVPAAYALAKRKMKGSGIIILVFLISQMLPEVFTLTPYLAIFRKLGLYNTYFAPMIACCTLAVPFCVIMLRPYFLTVPQELEDAARIDGCSHWKAFVKVMMPIASPGIAVAFVFSFLFAYGDMMYSLNLTNDSTMWPVTTGIYSAVGRYGMAWDRGMAFACLIVLPVFVIFLLLQRYIVEGLTSGSVKG